MATLSKNGVEISFSDQGAGDGGAQQILAFIDGIGPEHREDEVAHEFLAQVVHEDVLGLDAQQFGLVPGRAQFLALAQVGGEGHHLAIIGHLQPFQDDAGIQPARIGKHDLLHVLLRHATLVPGIFGGGKWPSGRPGASWGWVAAAAGPLALAAAHGTHPG